MKFLFIFLALVQFAFSADEEIPHYKIYPRTPIIDYQEANLDFYSVKNVYGEFSNFALFPININGVIWPTSEHFYQAQKFFDHDLQEKVRTAETPLMAAQIGRDPNNPMRADWDQVKDGIMLIALRAKYTQYDVLKKLLLSTNKSHLFEHTINDCYWADCGDRTGKNMLGQELMQIREELAR
jgi:ribA/ribD-fused uncharacterized protein